MNRKELVAAIAAHTGQDTKTVDASMRGFVDVTLASVAKGETVQMPGFAKFAKVKRGRPHGPQSRHRRGDQDKGVREGPHHAVEGVQGRCRRKRACAAAGPARSSGEEGCSRQESGSRQESRGEEALSLKMHRGRDGITRPAPGSAV